MANLEKKANNNARYTWMKVKRKFVIIPCSNW